MRWLGLGLGLEVWFTSFMGKHRCGTGRCEITEETHEGTIRQPLGTCGQLFAFFHQVKSFTASNSLLTLPSRTTVFIIHTSHYSLQHVDIIFSSTEHKLWKGRQGSCFSYIFIPINGTVSGRHRVHNKENQKQRQKQGTTGQKAEFSTETMKAQRGCSDILSA